MRLNATVRRLAVWTVAFVSTATAYADSPRPSVKPPTTASRAKSHRARATHTQKQKKTRVKGHKRNVARHGQAAAQTTHAAAGQTK